MGGQSFQYDSFNRRISQTQLGAITSYLYDGPNAVQQYTNGVPATSFLVNGVDQRFQLTDSGGSQGLISDALDSTLALIDSGGAITTQYTFGPFGETAVSGPSMNSYQYTGREHDASQLYYYRARYYNPIFKRFISEDPSGLSGGLNLYEYASDSPTNRIDPFGLDATSDGIARLEALFPNSEFSGTADTGTLLIHSSCSQVTCVLLANGYQNAESWRYNGPGSAFFDPIYHSGREEWRTFGPGFHFGMVEQASYLEAAGLDPVEKCPTCALDQFHTDSYNPLEPGQRWLHIKCDFLHLCFPPVL